MVNTSDTETTNVAGFLTTDELQMNRELQTDPGEVQ